ncbi:zinc-binding dehydrogenase [Acinetobacter baumannii]|uniref:zinc-binding dehydrogenase n=1 Tax=Acinetobacter baumannii TaxID=470 RepID=UPI002AF6B5AD|nr:zinc-binding dehydrogenase [Acinetobacter baumannii]
MIIQRISDLFKLIEEGKLKPTIDHIYQFDDMVNVHTLLEQNKTIGKVIVSI